MDPERKKSIDEKLHDRAKYLDEFQTKFNYYILAINAACIGFAISFTKESSLSMFLVPLAFAIIMWGISFYLGIRELQLTELSLILNFKILEAQSHNATDLFKTHFSEWVKKVEKIKALAKRKMRCLYGGVFIFIVWDILNMYLHN
jgi:hypothetical protein